MVSELKLTTENVTCGTLGHIIMVYTDTVCDDIVAGRWCMWRQWHLGAWWRRAVRCRVYQRDQTYTTSSWDQKVGQPCFSVLPFLWLMLWWRSRTAATRDGSGGGEVGKYFAYMHFHGDTVLHAPVMKTELSSFLRYTIANYRALRFRVHMCLTLLLSFYFPNITRLQIE